MITLEFKKINIQVGICYWDSISKNTRMSAYKLSPLEIKNSFDQITYSYKTEDLVNWQVIAVFNKSIANKKWSISFRSLRKME